jgi:hypothetical protein
MVFCRGVIFDCDIPQILGPMKRAPPPALTGEQRATQNELTCLQPAKLVCARGVHSLWTT